MTHELKLRESLGVTRQSTGARRRAKIIAANVWGSSAYYPSEVLERDGARVFVAGTQMFENHLTESEQWERPEGDVNRLIGKLTSDALFEAEGEDGPGLYADVEFYESYLPRINEIANDIGLSVRAQGLTEEGEIDGRYGPILVALLAADSVDVVTRAGAGGKLTSILESNRDLAGRPIETEGTSVTDVTKEDFEALKVALQESISGLADTLSATLTEALKTVPAAEVQGAEKIEESEGEKAGEKQEVVIDHVAVVESLRDNDLPAVTAGAVIAALKEGKTLEEAVKSQVELREAFVASNESGEVHLRESQNKKSGLARSIEILG